MSASSAAAASAAYPDGLPLPRRYWAIAAIALAITMSVLDSTIVNVALPTIARDFRATSAASIWVINAYQLAILLVLLPLASLGEIVGYRRVSQAGLAIFTVASLGCAFAPSLLALSLARVVQGIGAAGIMSVNGALVRHTYPHRSLGHALGINAFVVATAAAVGPTIASGLLAVANWRWLFGINVPLGAVAIVIALCALPDSERTPRRLNIAGAALYAAAMGLLLSIAVGGSLGMAMARWRMLDVFVNPLVELFYPLPKSALIPVTVIWLGFGDGSKILLIFLACMIPVTIGAYNGARGSDHALIWSARSMGASPLRMMWDVIMPSALPELLNGIRTALALSFILLVSSELIVSQKGFGYLIGYLGSTGSYEGMYAVVLTVAFLGFAADRLYQLLMQWLLRWRE